MNCAEIWCVVRDQLAKRFTKVVVGYICTCVRVRTALFRISGTAERIALYFGMWVEGCSEPVMLKRRMLLDPLAMHFAQVMGRG